MSKFSTLFYNRKYLIIKSVEDKEPFAIAECFLPEMAQTICELLTENELETEQKQNEN